MLHPFFPFTVAAGSMVCADLAVAARPRYHIAAGKRTFWARAPYLNTDLGAGAHVTRFICLAEVRAWGPGTLSCDWCGKAARGHPSSGLCGACWCCTTLNLRVWLVPQSLLRCRIARCMPRHHHGTGVSLLAGYLSFCTETCNDSIYMFGPMPYHIISYTHIYIHIRDCSSRQSS
jgi:hypothetical protein